MLTKLIVHYKSIYVNPPVGHLMVKGHLLCWRELPVGPNLRGCDTDDSIGQALGEREDVPIEAVRPHLQVVRSAGTDSRSTRASASTRKSLASSREPSLH